MPRLTEPWYVWSTGSLTSANYVWGEWVSTANANTTSATCATGAWEQWVTLSDTTVAGEVTSSRAWLAWTTAAERYTVHTQAVRAAPAAPVLTAEERAARERQWEAERQERVREKAAADQRAETLLLECLSPAQRRLYQQKGYFCVKTGDGRRYRIRKGRSGNVEELDRLGRAVTRFCIHPLLPVPDADTMLSQKLLLETDEPRFRRTANQTALRPMALAAPARA